MLSEAENLGLHAEEFWCSLCEQELLELDIKGDNEMCDEPLDSLVVHYLHDIMSTLIRVISSVCYPNPPTPT